MSNYSIHAQGLRLGNGRSLPPPNIISKNPWKSDGAYEGERETADVSISLVKSVNHLESIPRRTWKRKHNLRAKQNQDKKEEERKRLKPWEGDGLTGSKNLKESQNSISKSAPKIQKKNLFVAGEILDLVNLKASQRISEMLADCGHDQYRLFDAGSISLLLSLSNCRKKCPIHLPVFSSSSISSSSWENEINSVVWNEWNDN